MINSRLVSIFTQSPECKFRLRNDIALGFSRVCLYLDPSEVIFKNLLTDQPSR